MAVTVTSGNLSAVPITDHHERVIDTDSQGTLWICYNGISFLEFAYSTDNGATWTDYGGATISTVDERSIFIDANDVIHLVYIASGVMTYRKISISYSGTPSLTYGVSYTPSGNTYSYPHVVAHPQGTDKKIHVGYHSSTGQGRYTRLNLSSSDVVTEDTHNTATGLTVGRGDIDFYHTGDGQTVKDSTPHVFLSGVGGAGNNTLQFVKLSYSGGVWSFGTVRSIYTTNESVHYPSLAFDGTRVIFSGFDTLGAVRVFQRDAADTTTTDLSPGSMTLSGSNSRVALGYDADNGDIFLAMGDSTSLDPYYASYTRDPGTWSSKTQVEATSMLSLRFSILRHSRIQRIGMTYARDLATDDIRYHEIAVLNSLPTAAITTPTDGETKDTSAELLLDWDFTDADGDTQTHYTVKRVIDALTTEYWNGTSWDSSESASTKIAETASAVTFPKNWGDPSTETIHTYSVKVWDSAGLEGAFSSSIDVYPFSNDSTNRGLALPRPYKKQDNLLATLKSNNDYMLSWVNNYVPAYGDLNDDLYVRAGLRPGSTSTMRSMFPPSVGVFSVGNGTNYFQDLGATNVYRTNELALSSEESKQFFESYLDNALGLVASVPVEQFVYNEEKRNYDAEYRFGLVLEDLKHTINELGIRADESAFIIADKDGNEFLNTEQLVYVLWKAVQELYALVDPSERRVESRFKRLAPRLRPRRNQK